MRVVMTFSLACVTGRRKQLSEPTLLALAADPSDAYPPWWWDATPRGNGTGTGTTAWMSRGRSRPDPVKSRRRGSDHVRLRLCARQGHRHSGPEAARRLNGEP